MIIWHSQKKINVLLLLIVKAHFSFFFNQLINHKNVHFFVLKNRLISPFSQPAKVKTLLPRRPLRDHIQRHKYYNICTSNHRFIQIKLFKCYNPAPKISTSWKKYIDNIMDLFIYFYFTLAKKWTRKPGARPQQRLSLKSIICNSILGGKSEKATSAQRKEIQRSSKKRHAMYTTAAVHCFFLLFAVRLARVQNARSR